MADVLVDVVSTAGSGRPTVLCVPHAGAGAGGYSRWGAILEPVADFTIVRLPGREDLCFVDPLATLSEITTAIASDLAGRAPGPIVLYGHCTGGLLAYELAHTLRAAGHTVDRLVVSSAPRPGTTPPDQYLHRLGDDGLKAYMVGFAGGGADEVDEEVDDELWELVEPAIRADLVAAELGQYTPDPLDVPVAAIRGRHDDIIPIGNTRRWAECTSAGFELVELDCGHAMLDTRPAELAGELARLAVFGS